MDLCPICEYPDIACCCGVQQEDEPSYSGEVDDEWDEDGNYIENDFD